MTDSKTNAIQHPQANKAPQTTVSSPLSLTLEKPTTGQVPVVASGSNPTSKGNLATEIKPDGKPKVAEVRINKMELATEIYKQMVKVKGVTRQDVIQRFIEQAGLTKSGAATYYQMIKQKLTV